MRPRHLPRSPRKILKKPTTTRFKIRTVPKLEESKEAPTMDTTTFTGFSIPNVTNPEMEPLPSSRDESNIPPEETNILSGDDRISQLDVRSSYSFEDDQDFREFEQTRSQIGFTPPRRNIKDVYRSALDTETSGQLQEPQGSASASTAPYTEEDPVAHLRRIIHDKDYARRHQIHDRKEQIRIQQEREEEDLTRQRQEQIMRFRQEEVDRVRQLDQLREREAQRKKRQAHLNAKQEQEERENLILEELKRNKAIQEAEINKRLKKETVRSRPSSVCRRHLTGVPVLAVGES